MEPVISFMESTLGIGSNNLSIGHILLRCLVVYIMGIVLVRLGNKRFVGKMSAFDIIIAIIIGSLLSRAITHEDLFFPALGACLLLILLHRLFSYIAIRSDNFGNLIKGNELVIVENGQILWEAMDKSHLSEKDLMQTLRLNASVSDVSKIKIARLERNGDISVIMESTDTK